MHSIKLLSFILNMTKVQMLLCYCYFLIFSSTIIKVEQNNIFTEYISMTSYHVRWPVFMNIIQISTCICWQIIFSLILIKKLKLFREKK